MIAVKIERDIAALGDCHRVFYSPWEILEIGNHLLFGFEIKLVRPKTEAIAIVDRLAGLHAQQHIVSTHVRLIQIMTVVAGHQRDTELGTHFAQSCIDDILNVDTVVLHFQEEVVFPEQLLVGPCSCRQADMPINPLLCARSSCLSIRGR